MWMVPFLLVDAGADSLSVQGVPMSKWSTGCSSSQVFSDAKPFSRLAPGGWMGGLDNMLPSRPEADD